MDEILKTRILEAEDRLAKYSDVPLKMLIGLDGFVDEIIHVVDTRADFDTFTRVNTIEDFGQRILRAAGLSANIEFVPTQIKLGGNGPIFANALLEAGVSLKYIGSVGTPSIHPVFAAMAAKAETYAVCNPGVTEALEFNDGKLMLGKHSTLKEITWENIVKTVGGIGKFIDMVKESTLIGMENWTMIPHMSDIWQSIIDEVFPHLPDAAEKPLAFFDLADPEKRTNEDIRHAMELIVRFEEKFRAVLGLNEKEVYEIAEAFDIAVDQDDPCKLKNTVTSVYEKLNIYCLVVHPTKEAVACSKDGYFQIDGPYCKKPVLTTGAGDNFNAGFCLGLSLGLNVSDSLVLGVATSGFYVRNARSPKRTELIEFLMNWSKDALE